MPLLPQLGFQQYLTVGVRDDVRWLLLHNHPGGGINLLLWRDGTHGGSLLLLGRDSVCCAVLVDHLGRCGRGGVTVFPLVVFFLLPKNSMYGDGFKKGFVNLIAMADGYAFIGTKAYTNTHIVPMMISNFLHSKFHKSHGTTFSNIYPGCIAKTPLFR
jgi:hypothetical protein